MKKIIALIFIISYSLFAQTTIPRSNDITGEEIIYHIKHLSSDEFQGRRTGEEFCDSAGAYIEREFQYYGLKAFDNNYRQSYEVVYALELGEKNSLKINGVKSKIEINKNYTPLSFSSSEECKGEMAFVGYGIALSDSDYNYNDYANVDVTDKIVLIMLGIPEDTTSNKFMRFDNPRYKASIARDKGAKAIIFFNPEVTNEDKELPRLRNERASSSGLPIVQIRKSVAEELFKSIGKNLSNEISKIDDKKPTQSFVSQKTIINLTTEINEIKRNTFNVIGYIEGSNPSLKDEYIVIGAHYDHLGLGGASSLAPDTIAVHPGADDNASGVAGVLELAQYFSNNTDAIGRSIIFMAFSGEEEGLLGSAHYVNKSPIVPLEKTALMINMDMIGRMRDNKLIINGAGSSSKFVPLINKYNKDSTFSLKLNDEGFSPSDNSSFYGKNIPVMMFFTDVHLDYHKPNDTWEKINVEGQNTVLNFIKDITIDLSNESEKIDFVKPQNSAPSRNMPGFRVSTGIIPDFSGQVEGVKIQGAREGSPANKAGLISGDVIIKFGERTIKNLYDYTYALGEHRPGEKVPIIWIRDGQEMSGILELVRR